MTTTDWKNQLHFGDNLEILRNHVPDASVDLIYLDPPFNSNANYNVLFQEKGGQQSAAQITAFEDTWHWSLDSESAYQDVVTNATGKLPDLLQAMRSFLGDNDMMAYLTMMAQRVVELHRVLKDTGSIYLHCDLTASHYIKLLMDAVFGKENFRNEITWRRTTSHNDAKRNFGAIGDNIFYYTKTRSFVFNPQHLPYSEEQLTKDYKFVDENGRRYSTSNIRSPSPRPNLTYDYKGYKPHPNGWTLSRERMERLVFGQSGIVS